jgi:hypothetical protein
MTFIAAASIAAAATIGASLLGSSAAKSAAKTQSDAADRAAQLQADQFAQQRADQEPFRQAGITTQNELLRQLGLGGEASSAGYGNLMRNFGQQDFQADPGYGFRMSEGLKALDRQAAARGGLISGGALKAAQGYGQDLASQEYQNAFNRYQTNRGSVYGMLSGQQGVGQAATNAMGAAGQNYANQAGDAYMGAANARASGYIGSANAIGQGVGGLTNMYMQNQMMNRMFPTPSAGASLNYYAPTLGAGQGYINPYGGAGGYAGGYYGGAGGAPMWAGGDMTGTMPVG